MTGVTPPPATRVPTAPYVRPHALRADTLRLDGNEGSRSSPDLVADLIDCAPALMREYPDRTALEEVLAARLDVQPECVVVTAGADDAIDRCFRAYLEPGRELILPVPTFEMLHRFAALTGVAVVPVPWQNSFPTDAVVGAVTARTAMAVVVSPNNPTGLVATAADLRRISAALPQGIVLLDHAYVEYADADLTPVARELGNVVVIRTLSKAWGLAGCRVGYAVAPAEIASTLRNAGNPYPVAGMSVAVAMSKVAVAGEDVTAHVRVIRDERTILTDRLKRWDVRVSPSHANFVFAEFGDKVHFVRDALRVLGVLVRHFPHRSELAHGLRISLPGDAAQLDRLLNTLAVIMEPEALLLDLDGVIADVGQSYRVCIMETARVFGRRVTRRDVEAAMHAGDANNDWIVTQRLLGSRGVDVPLDDIVSTYQALYLGADGSNGLRERERLIVERETLRRLAARFPLGVVTGRPREEAEWFLDRFAIGALFSATVCLEDGPVKPDPSPIRLALERLDVRRAWMVGDTPDDVRAAGAAGVLGIGIVAPGDSLDATRGVLEMAGAATVLDSLADLEDLLP
jgi:histidinol-phosphate aminotransferase